MDIEAWPLSALAMYTLVAAEAGAYILRRPVLQPYEIRLLVAFGGTDYLYFRPGYFERWHLGHIGLIQEVVQQLDFVGTLRIGRIPEWSHFYQVSRLTLK